jgi:hypothetical protein
MTITLWDETPMARSRTSFGSGNNYGCIRRAKNYDNLDPMLKQLEDTRVQRGWTMDRLDMEAEFCPSKYRQIVQQAKTPRHTTVLQYATALGKSWKLV